MLRLSPEIRDLHNELDAENLKPWTPGDNLRARYGKLHSREFVPLIASAAERYADRDPSSMYFDHEFLDLVDYAFYAAKTMQFIFPGDSIRALHDIMHALPVHSIRARAAHRILMVMDSAPSRFPFRNPTRAELIGYSADIAETIRLYPSDQRVIELAEAHTVAHIEEGLAKDRADTLQITAELLNRLPEESPLRRKVAKLFDDNGGVMPPATGGRPGAGTLIQPAAPA